jgi:hypothetical protein
MFNRGKSLKGLAPSLIMSTRVAFEKRQIRLAVLIVKEHARPPVAAVRHMIRSLRNNDPSQSCHNATGFH